MDRLLRTMRGATLAAGAAAVAGIVVLFLYSLSEVLANPGISLEDGYWIGRLPWTAVGVALVVIGSTAAIALGTATAWLSGGWIRRVASGVALVVGACWWLLAIFLTPGGGAYCPSCPPPGPDPLTTAYSLPGAVVLLLLVPAAVTAALALGVGSPSSRTRPSIVPASG